MATSHAIRHVRITPVAFRDPPLLNAAGIHEPWALRSIIELETDSGRVGINESYGDLPMLEALERAAPALQGLSPWDLNAMEQRVAALVAPPAPPASEFLGQQVSLAPGMHVSKTVAKVVSAFEVAMLDLQGQLANAPVVDLLGGAARERVPFSAYLFYKYARHIDAPGSDDAWGEALTPQQLVAQARRMIGQYGFQSIKLKAGALPPGDEAAGILALAEAFPGMPLRIDPNANWTVATSLRIVQQLRGVLEYYEDPAPGLAGMAAVARECEVPLATNMVVTDFPEFRRNVEMGCPVRIVLSDHHYWGGLRATQRLGTLCRTFDLGLSMHSNSHLGISLLAMTHLCASMPVLAYACDTHYPWQDDEVVAGGRIAFEEGSVRVPTGAGLGATLDRAALARLHDNYLRCGIRSRDDLGQMKKYDPAFTGGSRASDRHARRACHADPPTATPPVRPRVAAGACGRSGASMNAPDFASSLRYPDPAVEVLDERFLKLRLFNASVERLFTGLRWAEGPVWFGDGRYLLVSDIPNDRILRWDEASGAVSDFRKPSNNANGHFRDRQGRLLSCEHLTRRVTRTEYDGRITVLADRYDGKRLNSPNDIVCAKDGSVWFTDPSFGIGGYWEGEPAEQELPHAVYRLAPDGGLEQVLSDLDAPNGLAFSPDESVLYIVESRATPHRKIWAYDHEAGKLSRKRVAADAAGPGAFDGFRVDVEGNLWCGFGSNGAPGVDPQGLDGVRVFAPDGTAIGHIHLPERCANVCFGGRHRNRLFMAASHSVYALYVNTQGA